MLKQMITDYKYALTLDYTLHKWQYENIIYCMECLEKVSEADPERTNSCFRINGTKIHLFH